MNLFLKRYLSAIFMMGLTYFNFQCDSPESKTVTGEWKLVEHLIDPGDGSGTFRAVSSDKTIRFYVDGTLKSNGSLCTPGSTSADQSSSGTFDVMTEEITIDDCQNTIDASFEGPYMILTYQCIEPCRDKYIKINSAKAE